MVYLFSYHYGCRVVSLVLQIKGPLGFPILQNVRRFLESPSVHILLTLPGVQCIECAFQIRVPVRVHLGNIHPHPGNLPHTYGINFYTIFCLFWHPQQSDSEPGALLPRGGFHGKWGICVYDASILWAGCGRHISVFAIIGLIAKTVPIHLALFASKARVTVTCLSYYTPSHMNVVHIRGFIKSQFSVIPQVHYSRQGRIIL